MGSATILLIRHCASLGQGETAGISPSGAVAADALAKRLLSLELDAIYSSPYRRALATIEPFATRASMTVAIDERLKERVLADEDRDDWLTQIERSFEDGEHCLKGGESMNATRDRGLAALADIAQGGHRRPVAVSHGALISAVLRACDRSFGFEHWRSLRNPDLFELSFRQATLTSWRRLD